jgi:excisionase family DNA binding protein
LFLNLCRNQQTSSHFLSHNFHTSSGVLHQVPDPSFDVELALRDKRGYLPSVDLIPTLSFTLSPGCCRCFAQQHPAEPITDRDYYLSKLYQFFLLALLDEGSEAAYYDEAARRLEELLDSVFPYRAEVPDLAGLNWLRIFADYKKRDLETSIMQLHSYLPSTKAHPAGTAPHSDRMNLEQAAKYLSLSGRHIRNLVREHKLDSVGDGRNKRITTESLRRYKGESTPSQKDRK